ncbi:hypothetical protein QUW33_07300 [Lactobacillus gallinarum]|uniref:hypothetical protein n=1 Tax=Lactobacillus gallinarum TaxID=52242 RepID=UPI0025A3F624|nr:hypothetical protein [Lactobacillus gallinarum]MDM8277226.1 hypothetical protein [Lactobacillus gallinarum]
MPKNLRHIFRSELIKQRKSGLRVARDAIKKSKNGKYADYRHIYSDNSYRKHWGRAQKFADFCRKNDVKKLEQITPEFAQKYLIYERDQNVNGYQGYSASTIGSDALMINHLMIGSGHWENGQRIQKSKLPDMPKRSTLLAKQRQKPVSSREWINSHPHTYAQYKNQIDTIRAFGLRRRELTGGSSQNGRDGLGDRSIYQTKDGRLFAIVQGKGGKIRWTECRRDLQNEMKQIYGKQIRPFSERPKSIFDYRHNLKINQPFYRSFDHNVPTHIHRAAYAQHMINQLNQQTYNGFRSQIIYYRDGIKPNGHVRYSKGIKQINLHDEYKIGIYKAQYGAFYALTQYMGHNRLDVLQSYLGIGR